MSVTLAIAAYLFRWLWVRHIARRFELYSWPVIAALSLGVAGHAGSAKGLGVMRDLLPLAPALPPPPWGACGQFLSTRSVFCWRCRRSLRWRASLQSGARARGFEEEMILHCVLRRAEAGPSNSHFSRSVCARELVHIERHFLPGGGGGVYAA